MFISTRPNALHFDRTVPGGICGSGQAIALLIFSSDADRGLYEEGYQLCTDSVPSPRKASGPIAWIVRRSWLRALGSVSYYLYLIHGGVALMCSAW